MGSNKVTLSQDVVDSLFKKNGLITLEPYVNSRTRIKSQCISCGKIVSPYYRQIWAGQRGCRDCSSKKFRLTAIELDKLFGKFELELIDNYSNNSTPVQVRCKRCGAFSKIAVKKLKERQKYWCPECSDSKDINKIKSVRWQDKSNLDQVSLEFSNHGFQLLEGFEGVSKPCSVRHIKCQTISEMTLKNIRKGKGFCLGCVKNKPLTMFQALNIIERAGLEPLEEYKNYDTPIKCKCKKCGRILSPTIHTLKSKKSSCSYCSRVKVDPKDAEIFMIKQGYRPLEPYTNSKAKWKSEHIFCGEICFPRYNSIYSGQGGCTKCAVGKFDFNETSYFYVMFHDQYDSFKIGISNSNAKTDRLYTHSKLGWRPLYKYEFENGYLAYDFEQSMITYLRVDLGIPAHLTPKQMPNGFSETLSAGLVSFEELIRIIKLNHAGQIGS